jgi:hypothetical protein
MFDAPIYFQDSATPPTDGRNIELYDNIMYYLVYKYYYLYNYII